MHTTNRTCFVMCGEIVRPVSGHAPSARVSCGMVLFVPRIAAMGSPQIGERAAISSSRRYPVGVELGSDGSAHARVWAPRRERVALVHLERTGRPLEELQLEPEGDGYFSGTLSSLGAGALYKLKLDDAGLFPDPASRFQPEGPHGPSQVVDARGYHWRDAQWKGMPLAGQVLYEMHIGTFTTEGTYCAAVEHLRDVADSGVTVLELMPVTEFAGRFGWGYDGVNLFAPFHHYGQPDDLRALVDAAHEEGLAVILDVVYNHLGPDGNYLREFSDHYFKGQTEWGDALNFDGEQSAPVRELFTSNASYWIEEFHFDGLRLDATQQIFDESTPHIIAEITGAVRAAAPGRSTIVVGENEPQNAKLIRPPQTGYGLDGLWNDDFHHCAIVATTGRSEAYYSGYRGTAQELVSTAKYGFLHQGVWFNWQGSRRGTPSLDVPAFQLVNFTQNHDQLANSCNGLRLHELTAPGRYRAITALLLLLPQTPMLFQGQEFAASSPFLYFADHKPELAALVAKGRAEFLGQFVSIATSEATSRLSEPANPSTFQRCKLDWRERELGPHAGALALVRDALRLRRNDETLRTTGLPEGGTSATRRVDGAVINDEAFVLRYFGVRPELDRLIVVNLGRRIQADPFAEPLAAPPADMLWRPIWSSEHPVYGGCGTPAVDTDDGGWWLSAECLVVLGPVFADRAAPAPHHPATEKEARAQWKSRHEKTAR